MKSKIFPTRKTRPVWAAAGLLLPLILGACDTTSATEAVEARVGQSLDEVVEDWGFPTGERTVVGRRLVYWEELEYDYDDVPRVGLRLPFGGGEVEAQIALTDPEELTCTRELQLDADETVVAADLKGNNCPYFVPSDW